MDNDRSKWIRANAGGVWPDLPSPQALDAFQEIWSAGESPHLARSVESRSEAIPLVKAVGGRLYFNVSQARLVCAAEHFPLAWVLERLGRSASALPEEIGPPPASVHRFLTGSLRDVWRHLRTRSILSQHGAKTAAHLRRLLGVNPADLSDIEVWTVLEAWTADAPSYLQPFLPIGGLLLHEARIRRICARAGVSFERLLAAHRQRPPLGFDWSQPANCDDSESVDRSAGSEGGASASPRSPHEGSDRDDARAYSGRVLRTFEAYRGWRSQMDSNMSRVMVGLRRWHLALAERFVERGWLVAADDYFLLRLREIAPIVNGQCRADTLGTIVADRVAERERHRALDPPLWIGGSGLAPTKCADRNSPVRDTEVGPSFF